MNSVSQTLIESIEVIGREKVARSSGKSKAFITLVCQRRTGLTLDQWDDLCAAVGVVLAPEPALTPDPLCGEHP
ncbi:MAG: hypothetical protein K8T91_25725 [Planctomycetes bacterium]|nr:hypothetical protein [Planctomycetota bacterium]